MKENLNTVVMFVGEAWASTKTGRPAFVGRSGQYLTETLERLGIARSDVYITNVVKCRPPRIATRNRLSWKRAPIIWSSR